VNQDFFRAKKVLDEKVRQHAAGLLLPLACALLRQGLYVKKAIKVIRHFDSLIQD